MSRESAFRGNWTPNKRPYVVVTPDVYVAFQGETSVIGCGDCKRQVSINDYVTGISTEASVDGGVGSSTINLSIPDNDVNDFFVDGQFLIIPMMEVEIYSKGYFLVGGIPQYYKIFWGIVQSVSKSWSSGSTTIGISCKDILRWWELTLTTTNPAFLGQSGSSAGNFAYWGNQFAGMNPYTIIIALAQQAMGDFSVTQGSFMSFLPEHGPEKGVIASYAKDLMAYWQLKFGNMWNALVLYGTSGQAYQFTSDSGTFSPMKISSEIFKNELEKTFINQQTTLFKQEPTEIFAIKKELDRYVNVEFFQTEQQSKLSMASTVKEQAGFEFYCDTTGDIVFKPPFYNLNVLPNKPVSWVQDYEVIDDHLTDTEDGVITHLTSAGVAFGGVGFDAGLSDEITTPRTGVIDFHLLRRYGWRKQDYQCEWASNPHKLFYHLLDYIDRINCKRQSGSVTIPLRPEIRMGFPMWFPKYDSFFYINGISHQYAVGGQATTTLQLIAKRSKFIAPNNIGIIKQTDLKSEKAIGKGKEGNPEIATGQIRKFPVYTVEFPTRAGQTTGQDQSAHEGEPVYLRDPKTGKLLGYPNVVMVYRAPHDGTTINRIIETMGGSIPGETSSQQSQTQESANYKHKDIVDKVYKQLLGEEKQKIIDRIRAHRYEAGMTNAGAYDYAFDSSRSIKEFQMIPIDSVTWQPVGAGGSQFTTEAEEKTLTTKRKEDTDAANALVTEAATVVRNATTSHTAAEKALIAIKKKLKTKPSEDVTNPDIIAAQADVDSKSVALEAANVVLNEAKTNALIIKNNAGLIRRFASLNMLIRPVSDEFGFEVIGHYRYGRGSYIDRGQLRINNPESQNLANQLNVQFAPSGGLLTDPSVTGNADGSVVSFSDSFEKMQPDDYATGASFKGYATGGPTDIVQTTQNTYTNLVNSSTGKSVFIEADALRRSKLLGELSPTLDIPGLEATTKPCSCGLGRNNWLSILPVEVIKNVVNGKTFGFVEEPIKREIDPEAQKTRDAIGAEIDAAIAAKKKSEDEEIAELQKKEQTQDITDQIDAIKESSTKFVQTQEESKKQRQESVPNITSTISTIGADPNKSFFIGNVTSGDFFNALQKFLKTKFQDEYDRSNALREQAYTVRDRKFERTIADPVYGQRITSDLSGLSPLDGNPEDNILGDPSDPLFGAASRGDPDALKALEQKANFNFGSSKNALSNLKDAWKSGKEKIIKDANSIKLPYSKKDLKSAFKMDRNGKIDASPGPQTQPYGTPLPLPSIIKRVDVSRLRGITVGSAILGSTPVILSDDRTNPPQDARTAAPVPPEDYKPLPGGGIPNVTILNKPKP